ncbi:protein FAM133A-like [Parasteatoda tepidariorum]|uniref:protein FAM133A-like n=1 Tax=Parasteatoda tepidariorum TaxID=114398 RepID=UPI001C725A33|nr:nucleolar RNA helicase 2-like [Parasteatoda tepidariorum]
MTVQGIVQLTKKPLKLENSTREKIPESSEIPVETPITDIEETEQAPENNSITPSKETEQIQEPIEEASTSESEKSTSNNNEPPAKKRKRKKRKPAKVTKTTTSSTTTTSISLSSPESLSQPEPMITSETTDETHNNDKETSKKTEKALPPKNAKILIRGLPDDFDTEEISQEFGKLDLKLHKVIQFKKRMEEPIGSSPFSSSLHQSQTRIGSSL